MDGIFYEIRVTDQGGCLCACVATPPTLLRSAQAHRRHQVKRLWNLPAALDGIAKEGVTEATRAPRLRTTATNRCLPVECRCNSSDIGDFDTPDSPLWQHLVSIRLRL